jgi:hypothetical protein
VTGWFREVAFVSTVEEPSASPPKPDRDEIDDGILPVLAEQRCAAVRNGSRLSRIPGSSMHPRVTAFLAAAVRRLRCVLDVLSDVPKRIRVDMSGGLLQLLQVQEASRWNNVVILDES